MKLDELLTRTGTVDAPAPDLLDATAAELASAARTDITRRAVLVRRRRLAKIGSAAVGVTAAAAIVGVVSLQPSMSPARSPQTGAPISKTPVTQDFKTVAQVINAAAEAFTGDPTAAPYWKVTTGGLCGGDKGTYRCDLSMWVGNGRPGVMQDGTGSVTTTCEGVGTIAGQTLSWKAINSRTWTDAQLATLAAGADANIRGGGAAVTPFYIMKNAAGLMTYTPISAVIRKQFWKQLETVPGVKFEGRHKDALGRTGWLLSLVGPSGSGQVVGQSILVDTTTGMGLEESDWVVGNPKNVTTVVYAGPADSAPAPTSRLRTVCGPLEQVPGAPAFGPAASRHPVSLRQK